MLDKFPPKIRNKGVKSKKYKQVEDQHNQSMIRVTERAPVPGPGSKDIQQSFHHRSGGREAVGAGKERTCREETPVG